MGCECDEVSVSAKRCDACDESDSVVFGDSSFFRSLEFLTKAPKAISSSSMEVSDYHRSEFVNDIE